MSALNNYQQRYVLSVLSQVNHYLENIEELIHSGKSPFRYFEDDILPEERNDLATFIRALRAEMLSIRDSFQLDHNPDAESARWVVHTNLEFASVELMELTKAKMAGYGSVNNATFQDLNVQISRLRQIIDLQMGKFPP